MRENNAEAWVLTGRSDTPWWKGESSLMEGGSPWWKGVLLDGGGFFLMEGGAPWWRGCSLMEAGPRWWSPSKPRSSCHSDSCPGSFNHLSTSRLYEVSHNVLVVREKVSYASAWPHEVEGTPHLRLGNPSLRTNDITCHQEHVVQCGVGIISKNLIVIMEILGFFRN